MTETRVIHEQAAPREYEHEVVREKSSFGGLIALVITIILVAAFIFYVVPILRTASIPKPGTQINVPDKINIDVNTPNQAPPAQPNTPSQPGY